MNYFRSTIQRTTLAGRHRAQSAASPGSVTQGVHNVSRQSAASPHLRGNMNGGFNEQWLSNPSILVFFGGALTFLSGMALQSLVFDEGASKKHTDIQQWGSKRFMSVVKRTAEGWVQSLAVANNDSEHQHRREILPHF
ncbi:expressed unknown protein [Seminavis robusta]|uniref:Uncharacterized protein n=1 Tax=Seminavis robusta TaxID=568900 RepID=A0A9N8EMW2_9STRA|nr:expressed unknown protein [Seminavis robusta]|eukprot:Sro1357_g265780.1 n/a (138) ;mRNA; r:23921-24425